MKTQGSAGNVIAAVCSVLIPGLGQLTQARFLKALVHLILWGIFTFFSGGLLWWVMHVWSCYEAARFVPPAAKTDLVPS